MSATMRSILKSFLQSQQWLCENFDKLLAPKWRVDGHADFRSIFVKPHLAAHSTVYDIGGGKQPYFSPEEKHRLALRVVGLDIDQSELQAAQAGCYDETICADVIGYEGRGDADLVICQAVLEHVRDSDRALASIASVLKSGGKALLFLPCRTAIFARLNVILPESWKRGLLFALFPHARTAHGFRSYYDRCTPWEYTAMASAHGLTCEQLQCYHKSAYFSFLFPLYVLWRAWVLLAGAVQGSQQCESFSMVLRKTQ